ncbi:dynamin family protein [Maridesulfovibrio sp.]|uniref:dynamin family protein n=1 Tax=Maridesulfovibrio sp. TaxID=2795000 RepID=UPI002A18DF1B|nr:dynamin family protein [Maridesulfovibrio sp.]
MSSNNMPILANFPTLESICSGNSLTDNLATLLGGIVNADGIVTIEEIQQLDNVYELVFGKKKGQRLDVRAKTLYKILNPASEIDLVIKSVCKGAKESVLGHDTKERILNGFIQVINDSHQLDSNGANILIKLYEGFELDSPSIKENLEQLVKAEPSLKYTEYIKSFGITFKVTNPFSRKESGISTFTPETWKFNREMAASIREIEGIASQIESGDLLSECSSLFDMLQEQPFKIVICGEVKRGKSTLFNALLGKTISPVREGLAETATNFKIQHAKTPSYSGTWLSEESLDKFKIFLSENGHEHELNSLDEIISQCNFEAGGLINSIESYDDVIAYTSAKGEFSCLVEDIIYSDEIELLKDGAVLVDTPGLNDPIGIRNDFSLTESLTADCILFVVSAKAIGASEIEYLKRIINEGRAVNLILAISHIDQISEVSRDEIIADRVGLVEKLCADSSVSLLGCVPVNALQAMESRCSDKYTQINDTTGLSSIIKLIESNLKDDNHNSNYREKVKEKHKNLLLLAEKCSQEYAERMQNNLPSDDIMDLLETNSETIKNTCDKLVLLLRERLAKINADADHMVADFLGQFETARKASNESLERAIREKVEYLGSKFAKEDEWKDFDSHTSVAIVNNWFDPVQENLKKCFQEWDRQKKGFDDTNKKEIACNISVLQESAQGIAKACSVDSSLQHLSASINSTMKNGEKIALGAGATSMLMSGTSLATLAPTVANPVTLSALAAVAALYGVIRLLTSEKKAKEQFINKKMKGYDELLSEQVKPLGESLKSSAYELKQEFLRSAERQYIPTLTDALVLVQYNRLYLDVLKKSSEGVPHIMDAIQTKLKAVEA